MPAANVTISSPQLISPGAETVPTSDKGLYRIPLLPPGVYSIAVEIEQGFQGARIADIQLKSGAALGVDFTLKVAAVSETVEVTGQAPLVDVKNSQVQNLVDDATLQALPIGRNFADAVADDTRRRQRRIRVRAGAVSARRFGPGQSLHDRWHGRQRHDGWLHAAGDSVRHHPGGAGHDRRASPRSSARRAAASSTSSPSPAATTSTAPRVSMARARA